MGSEGWLITYIWGVSSGLSCGSLLVISVTTRPSLRTVFRRRLRESLALAKASQVAFADSIRLSQAQVSRILNFDHVAAQVTVARIEDMSAFLHLPPSNLLRLEDDEPMVLTGGERELLELIRMLPDAQQQNLTQWLAYVFPERRSAQAEMAVIRQLNVARQRERDREREELQSLKRKK